MDYNFLKDGQGLSVVIGRMYKMLEALKKADAIYGFCPQSKLGKIFELDDNKFKKLLNGIENSGYIIWHINDIIASMADEYPLVNEADAKEILACMLDAHDADTGIRWENIRIAAEVCGFYKKHQLRMAEAFPFSLQKENLDWINQYMTAETWEAGRYEDFLLSLTDDGHTSSCVKQLVRREHLICEFKNHVAYYYFSLMRFAKDNGFPVLAMLAPHLTAIMVREIMDNDEECEV